MAERLLVVLLLAAMVVAAYRLLREAHLRRLNGGPVAAAPPPAAGLVQAGAGVAGVPTLVYFGSDACAACPTQARYLDQLQRRWLGPLQVVEVDAVAEPETAAAYGVFTLPTILLVDGSGMVRQVNYGVTPPPKLARQLAKLPGAAPALAPQADGQLI